MTCTRNFSNWAYWRLHLEQIAEPARPDDVQQWRSQTRRRIAALLGPDPRPVAPTVETTESVDCGTYRRDRIVFDTEATMSVPAFMLTPHERDRRPGPAVLAIHGHGLGKSDVCGLDGDRHGQDYARQLVGLGYAVLAPDLRGFGERRDWMPPDRYHCDWNLVCATMAGIVPLGRNIWDMQRALDVLAAHPSVDPGRLGVAGLSYGATCALFVAAVDDRVRAVIVSGYLSSWRAAHAVPWNMCGSQVMAGQLGVIEHLDVAALVAPRPMLVESGTDDLIFPVAAARQTVTDLGRVYDALGAPANALAHHVFGGDHRWDGARAPEFLRAWL